MRILSHIATIALLFSLLLQSNVLLAKGKWKDYNKTIEKEHTIGQTGDFEIDTKHSNIDITTWDKETVSVKTVISVEAKSEEEAEEFLTFLNLEFIEGSTYLKCVMENSYHENYTWRDYLPWNISNYKTLQFKIEHKIQMPKGANLKIENKHGNVNIPDLDGKVDVELRYGNLSVGTIANDMKLELKHGNADVASLKTLNAELGYSNFSINKAEKIYLESRHSEIDIREVDHLESESRYDEFQIDVVNEVIGDCRYSDFEIGTIDNIKLDASYSDFTMDNLSKSIQVDLRYGDFEVKELDENFKEIDINSEYTDVDIDLDESTDYSLQLEGLHLSLPEKLSKLKNDIEDNTSEVIIKTKEKIKGLPLIRAKMRYGSLRVE